MPSTWSRVALGYEEDKGTEWQMFEFGFEKILLIMLVILLLFGARRIPEIGSSLGRGIRDFKRSMNDLQNDLHGQTTSAPATERALPAGTQTTDAQRIESDIAAQPIEARAEPKRLLN